MADGVFNIAKGAAKKLAENNTGSLQVILLQANEASTALVDHDNVSALLGAAGNSEATFTNYSRKTALSETVDLDDTNDLVDIDVSDQTWTSAGGTTDNTLTKALVCVQTGTNDTSLIPLTHHDFSVTTDGSDLTIQFNAEGFFRSS